MMMIAIAQVSMVMASSKGTDGSADSERVGLPQLQPLNMYWLVGRHATTFVPLLPDRPWTAVVPHQRFIVLETVTRLPFLRSCETPYHHYLQMYARTMAPR